MNSSSFPCSWFFRRFAGFLGWDLRPLGAGRLRPASFLELEALDGTSAAYRKAQIQKLNCATFIVGFGLFYSKFELADENITQLYSYLRTSYLIRHHFQHMS